MSQPPQKTPAANKPQETPAANPPQETPTASKPQETPIASKPQETPTASKPQETPTASKPQEAPTASKSQETPAASPPACSKVALVIDDEPANRDFLVRLLEQARLEVKGASTAEEALKIVEQCEQIAVIVIDNRLPDMDGVELLARLRPRYPNAHMIMATMLDERSLMEKAFENGCDVFMVKPHGFMELFRRLQMPGEDMLRRIIIDQYGPRPYRG